MNQSIHPSKKIQDLFQKLCKGDQILQKKKVIQAIFGLGLTGAGKSTLMNLLINSPLKIKNYKGRIVIDHDQDGQGVLAKIGQTTKSCTDIPNHIQFQMDGVNYNLYDCPGFLDTNRFDSVISNSYYIYQLFSKIPKIKFLLIVDESTILGNIARQFIKSIFCFLNLFKFDQNFSVQKLAQHCVLVINKARNDLDNLNKMIQQILSQYQNDPDFQSFRMFLNQFIINQEIQIVELVQNDYSLPNVASIWQKIKQKQYWERDMIDQQNIDMKQINFRIGEKELQGSQIALAEKAFKKCEQNIQQIILHVKQALEEIEEELNQESENYKFYSNWRKIINSNNFKGKQWNFNSVKSKTHLNKLKHLKQIYHTLSKYQGDEIQMTTKNIHSQMLNIMEMFAEYVQMNDQQLNILRQFTFILNRRFQESKVLQKLSDKFILNNRQSFDTLKGFLSHKYQDIQESYVKHFEKTIGKSRSYYQELLILCDKYVDTIPNMIQFKSFYKNQIANIQKKSNNISEALKLLIQSRDLNQQAYAEQNRQHYLRVDINLNKTIAQLLYLAELFEQSLMFYRVIDNTQMIQKCFQVIKKNISKNAIKLYQMYLAEGDYFRQIIQFDKALQKYKTAVDLTQKEELKQEASMRIIQTIKNKKQYIQKYDERIKRKQFYYKLSDKFNKEETILKILMTQKAEDIQQSQFLVSMRMPLKN